jgi:hypothetical protein
LRFRSARYSVPFRCSRACRGESGIAVVEEQIRDVLLNDRSTSLPGWCFMDLLKPATR